MQFPDFDLSNPLILSSYTIIRARLAFFVVHMSTISPQHAYDQRIAG